MTIGSASDSSPALEKREGRHIGRAFVVALAGNPNVGKTTLFNALTGLQQKVANYPGVTVEKKVGRCSLKPRGARDAALAGGTERVEVLAEGDCQIVDLPGTYSLAAQSPDEHVARQVLLGQIAGTPRPDVIVVVADASNLERNLYLVTQVMELGRPAVVALTMSDVATKQGKRVDVEKLSRHLRAAVVAVEAHRGGEGRGMDLLRQEIARAGKRAARGAGADGSEALELPLPEIMETHIERLKKILVTEGLSAGDQAYFDAHLMISTGEEEASGKGGDLSDVRRLHPKVRTEISEALAACEKADIDPIAAEVETHYAFISSVVNDCMREEQSERAKKLSRTDRIDRVVTHRIWGMLIFVGMMGAIFWAIFSFAQPIMDFLQKDVVGNLGTWVGSHMADGPLNSLIVDGIIGGVGNVVVFLPQIVLLFLFLAVLEDSGYMSRAAFLMDRVMSKVGLHGKSFIPLLSGYACAVPAIMGCRVIENRRDRLATILILPLMSCSARLPVYSLLIALFWGRHPVIAAVVMLSMNLLGTLSAFALAWLFKRTLLRGPAPAFILEMPPYRLPQWKVVVRTVSQRCWAFLKRAGTVIFAFSVVMWAATLYPNTTEGTPLANQTQTLDQLTQATQAQLDAGADVPGLADQLNVQLAALATARRQRQCAGRGAAEGIRRGARGQVHRPDFLSAGV